MSVARFQKKPVIVEAMQWNGPPDDATLSAFAGHWASIGAQVFITTPEGAMRVSPGDWVIRGVKGEFYPCKPDVFAATYASVKELPTTVREFANEIDALEQEIRFLRLKASQMREADLRSRPLAERLVYAAVARCPCGAGLAYDPASSGDAPFRGPSAWDCSAIILGTADRAVAHTDRLPFAFYKVKSEGQASANGQTTRPASVPVAGGQP